jgi:hypothetical protein
VSINLLNNFPKWKKKGQLTSSIREREREREREINLYELNEKRKEM